jgi:glycosyltransferase involved in cell wall biosynthesis
VALKSLANQLGVEDNVVFPGPLCEREKLEAYVDAAVFVLQSHYESFGNVVLEALACGTPVIVTNNCGVSEWISGDVGYIVESNEEELCNALERNAFFWGSSTNHKSCDRHDLPISTL